MYFFISTLPKVRRRPNLHCVVEGLGHPKHVYFRTQQEHAHGAARLPHLHLTHLQVGPAHLPSAMCVGINPTVLHQHFSCVAKLLKYDHLVHVAPLGRQTFLSPES